MRGGGGPLQWGLSGMPVARCEARELSHCRFSFRLLSVSVRSTLDFRATKEFVSGNKLFSMTACPGPEEPYLYPNPNKNNVILVSKRTKGADDDLPLTRDGIIGSNSGHVVMTQNLQRMNARFTWVSD